MARITSTSLSLPSRAASLVAVTMLAMCLLADLSHAGEKQSLKTNVARGAKYTLWPQPNYAHCTDPLDSVQLTDGHTTAEYFWTQQGTVGWSGTPYIVITIDLGRIEPLGGVSMTTAAGAAGVLWPAMIHIHASDDGKQYRDVGDLVALDLQTHGPWPKGYAIRRLETDALKTRGRYVRLMVVPLSGGPYIFTDEVEVFRGPEELLHRDPEGALVGEPAEIFRHDRVQRALNSRFAADAQGLEEAIRATQSIDEPTRNRLLSQLGDVRKTLQADVLPHDASLRAILPIGDAHASLFRLQAELWRATGAAELTAAAASPWDPLSLFERPASATRSMEVHAMNGEYRAAAANLANCTERPLEVHVSCEGLPGSPSPGYLTVHEVPWTDSAQGTPVAAALPEASRSDQGWVVTVLPGLVRQVWFTFHVTGTAPGMYRGKVVFRAAGREPKEVPVQLRVWPIQFPRQTTLWLGGWDYSDGDGSYGITPNNRDSLIKHLREHFVNAPWASGAVMPEGAMSGESPTVQLDTRRMDAWIARWPDARQYMVFLAAGSKFSGASIGTPEFDRKVAAWISAWVRHWANKGISADRVGLLIHDEPCEETDVRAMVAWARAIRAAEPKVVIWEDPIYQAPHKAPPELFHVCHVVCPNRPMWLAGGQPFAQFYLDQQRRGCALQFYSCSGPARSLDPYSYYRLQAWHCWQIGATGSHFWAFGDNGGASSWNEYLVTAGPFTPLFLDDSGVTSGKQMEAIREGVEDYESLVMLREAVKRAKAAGRNDNAVTSAERLLSAGVAEVLAAPGADQLFWQTAKDRSRADAMRVQVLQAIVALR